MSTQIDPTAPPPQRGGCCGMGCLAIAALLIFFALALAGGAFWAVRHVSNTYTEEEPKELPQVITSDEPAPVENAIPAATATPGTVIVNVPVPQTEARWKDFEKATRRSDNKQIELSAGEINALLQSHKNTRGKASVAIENNIGHVWVSIPLKKVPMMSGRYLNGEAKVEASPDGDPYKARIFDIVLAKSSVGDGVMNQQFFGLSSMRGYIDEWLRKQNITSFRIENNRVIGETNGPNEITR